MTKLLKEGVKIATQIESLYNELDYEGYDFFNIHHDNLRIQMDCKCGNKITTTNQIFTNLYFWINN